VIRCVTHPQDSQISAIKPLPKLLQLKRFSRQQVLSFLVFPADTGAIISTAHIPATRTLPMRPGPTSTQDPEAPVAGVSRDGNKQTVVHGLVPGGGV
jgi:hypothetical protein